jgi:hypothetical protein
VADDKTWIFLYDAEKRMPKFLVEKYTSEAAKYMNVKI